MKQLNIFINEKLKVNSKSKISKYTCKPVNMGELRIILKKRLKNNSDADLNDIDVSDFTDMNYLFYTIQNISNITVGNIDISQWDMSNVKNLSYMFRDCPKFNCDLSNWDVSNVEFMEFTFDGCDSFEGKGLDKWNISKCKSTCEALRGCYKIKNIPNWYHE